MQSSASTEESAPEASAAARPPGLLDEVKALWDDILGLVHDHLELAVLETRLAGESLVSMIIAGVMIAVLLVSAWLGLLGVLVILLIVLGMWASAALLIAVSLNLLIALALYGLIKRKGQHLQWKATLASLDRKHEPEKNIQAKHAAGSTPS